MRPKFICPLIAVRNIPGSRKFYEELLGQVVKFDFGQNVTYEGDFAIHDAEHFAGLLGSAEGGAGAFPKQNFELYFELDDMETLQAKLEENSVDFIHKLKAQPWQQRVMRFFDPDGYIIEVGESLEAVVERLHEEGHPREEIPKLCSMPEEFVNMVLGD